MLATLWGVRATLCRWRHPCTSSPVSQLTSTPPAGPHKMCNVASSSPAVQVGVVRLSRQTLQDLLTKALALDWTPNQAAILACTEGTESVVEAVARVRSLSSGQQVGGAHGSCLLAHHHHSWSGHAAAVCQAQQCRDAVQPTPQVLYGADILDIMPPAGSCMACPAAVHAQRCV